MEFFPDPVRGMRNSDMPDTSCDPSEALVAYRTPVRLVVMMLVFQMSYPFMAAIDSEVTMAAVERSRSVINRRPHANRETRITALPRYTLVSVMSDCASAVKGEKYFPADQT